MHFLHIEQCNVRGGLKAYHPGATSAQTQHISVLELTKHRTQNVSLVRRLLRTRPSVIYIENQAYVSVETFLVEERNTTYRL